MNLSTEMWSAVNAAQQGQAPITHDEILGWQRKVAALEAQVERLERNVSDLKDELPSTQERELLDALPSGYAGNSDSLVECLAPALVCASDLYGYSSPEYKAVDTIVNFLANSR